MRSSRQQWAALTVLFVAFSDCQPVLYEQCICSTGCDCLDPTGCRCPFSDSVTGICGPDAVCLDWGRVVCHEEQDLSLAARPEGSDCSSDPQDNGLTGKCMRIDVDGRITSETRCSRDQYWQCNTLDRGETCDDAGGQCHKPDGTDDTTHLSCMAPSAYACLGKGDGDACEFLYTGRDWLKYSKEHLYQSVCSQGVCLAVELGACYDAAEGSTCSYSTFEDESQCTKDRVRGSCPGETYYDLYKKEMQGGSCTGAFAESRTCEGADTVDAGVLQGSTRASSGVATAPSIVFSSVVAVLLVSRGTG